MGKDKFMFSRRYFLTGVSVSSAALCGTIIPSWVSAAVDEISDQDQKEYKVFMSLSNYLTGFDDLNEMLGKHFYVYLKQQSKPEDWIALFTEYESVASQANDVIKKTLVQDHSVWGVAKAINKLWYSGWLSVTDTIPAEIKAQAYKESLAWRAMEVTPKGLPSGRLWQHRLKQR